MFVDGLTTSYSTLIIKKTDNGKRKLHVEKLVEHKTETQQNKIEIKEMIKAQKANSYLRNTKSITVPLMMGAAYSFYLFGLTTNVAFAQDVNTSLTGGKSLIKLIQDATHWFGMGITIFGLVEMALGAPGWKGRVAKGIGVYVGALLIPYLFFLLENNLQNSVWEIIESGG